jgi:hypothetical protein
MGGLHLKPSTTGRLWNSDCKDYIQSYVMGVNIEFSGFIWLQCEYLYDIMPIGR